MILEITPTKKIEGAITVWNQPNPDVDVLMDLKKLTYREGSIDEIYAFHVLDHFFEDEGREAIKNWTKLLKVNGRLVVVVNDFEYLTRAFIGGDISIEEWNDNFSNPTNFTKDNLFTFFKEVGFQDGDILTWAKDIIDKGKVLFTKQDFELVFSSIKKND